MNIFMTNNIAPINRKQILNLYFEKDYITNNFLSLLDEQATIVKNTNTPNTTTENLLNNAVKKIFTYCYNYTLSQGFIDNDITPFKRWQEPNEWEKPNEGEEPPKWNFEEAFQNSPISRLYSDILMNLYISQKYNNSSEISLRGLSKRQTTLPRRTSERLKGINLPAPHPYKDILGINLTNKGHFRLKNCFPEFYSLLLTTMPNSPFRDSSKSANKRIKNSYKIGEKGPFIDSYTYIDKNFHYTNLRKKYEAFQKDFETFFPTPKTEELDRAIASYLSEKVWNVQLFSTIANFECVQYPMLELLQNVIQSETLIPDTKFIDLYNSQAERVKYHLEECSYFSLLPVVFSRNDIVSWFYSTAYSASKEELFPICSPKKYIYQISFLFIPLLEELFYDCIYNFFKFIEEDNSKKVDEIIESHLKDLLLHINPSIFEHNASSFETTKFTPLLNRAYQSTLEILYQEYDQLNYDTDFSRFIKKRLSFDIYNDEHFINEFYKPALREYLYTDHFIDYELSEVLDKKTLRQIRSELK